MKVYKFKCKGCGSKQYEKPDGHTYKCAYCGCVEQIIVEPVKNDVKQTEIAAEKIKEDARVAARTKEEEKALVNLLITLFVGFMGVHRFMKGKIISGILFLVTYGFFGIGVVVDLIKAFGEYRTVKRLNRTN